ncbi:MAG: aminomethyl-transferring glycine dehydrogenase [Alphaproteobacteria bacterium]
MTKKYSLKELTTNNDFVKRHIGPRPHQQIEMLKAIGFNSFEEMAKTIVPKDILENRVMDLKPAMSEESLLNHMRELSSKNKLIKTFIGQGYYGNLTPQVIIRNVLENPGWYTAYTPYQAEISQGRLEAIANFQTMVSDLTALDIANASLLDEGTAAAEAMSLCARSAKNKKANRFFISTHCHPQTIDVVVNRAKHFNIEIILGDEDQELPDNLMGALFQYPRTLGQNIDYTTLVEKLHGQGALAIVATDLLALTIMKTPGDMNFDIAVGCAQRFGVPFGFGGPHAGFFATSKKLQRSIPGRIIGVSIDKHGNPAYRMAMQTREQHIRREKATSNICTAQALLAIMANFYGVYHGPEGLKKIARRTNTLTRALAKGLKDLGYNILSDSFFDTIAFNIDGRSKTLRQKALDAGYNIRRVDSSIVSISFDETTTPQDVEKLLIAFGAKQINIEELANSAPDSITKDMKRTTEFMAHPVFNENHSETQLMRYARQLVNKDIALDRAMIPLGSCTMKLNSATEMKPVTLPGFSAIHPFAPISQTQGYRTMIETLEEWLCEITGYDAMSLQPNAGSQGEYAGLIAIKRYHESRGESDRNICLIPISAHGTNPASAQMVGMKVVAVACDNDGNIDIKDLQAKCDEYSNTVSAIMITYPSTHGVFEQDVRKVCEIVHNVGGQVYIDGANMNAQVGLTFPGHYGGDVSHLNLHKTFAIPHGGGGPGIGPIGVKSHLADFLPGHRLVDNGHGKEGAVTSAPWGSASVLTITYAYIAMLGSEGLKHSTEQAICSANYIAKKLEPYYSVLYKGKNGYIAHECIIDIRPLEEKSGISNEDIAKRLMDYGFHAPTMSFPVAGTLMIEPTESENLQELDRFIEAMIEIAKEINEVIDGSADKEDNVLKNAPHTAQEALIGEWEHSYSREKAIYPVKGLINNKMWPTVSRIDNVYGDRNLYCSCIPMEEYVTKK